MLILLLRVMDEQDKVPTYYWSESPPIPQGTRPLAHQVAGHVFGRDNGHRKNKIGFLQSDDGYILKPVLGPKKGLREVEFYKQVFDPNSDDEFLLSLRQFLPKYVGVWTTPEHPGMSYLKLEDATSRFLKPSIMDIKIGPVTYDMEADDDKIRREKEKFPALEEVGFQVVGIKVYSPATDSHKTIERTFLRALDKTTILTQGICQYFNFEDSLDMELVRAFIRQLCKIEAWFLSQRRLSFTASSLLFVYDGKALKERKVLQLPRHDDTTIDLTASSVDMKSRQTGRIDDNVSDIENFYDSITDVRMIDFTHAFTVDCLDKNYLVGLQSVIRYLTDLLTHA